MKARQTKETKFSPHKYSLTSVSRVSRKRFGPLILIIISCMRRVCKESWLLVYSSKQISSPTKQRLSHCCRCHWNVSCKTRSFRKASNRICHLGLDFIFDECNCYDSRQAHLIEGIGHCWEIGERQSRSDTTRFKRAFPPCFVSPFQNESSCKTLQVKMSLIYTDYF